MTWTSCHKIRKQCNVGRISQKILFSRIQKPCLTKIQTLVRKTTHDTSPVAFQKFSKDKIKLLDSYNCCMDGPPKKRSSPRSPVALLRTKSVLTLSSVQLASEENWRFQTSDNDKLSTFMDKRISPRTTNFPREIRRQFQTIKRQRLSTSMNKKFPLRTIKILPG